MAGPSKVQFVIGEAGPEEPKTEKPAPIAFVNVNWNAPLSGRTRPLIRGAFGTIAAALAANIVSEAYVTVIAWLPAPKLAFVKVATPFVLIGICFTSPEPSQNVTMPDGFALVGPIDAVVDAKTTALLEPTCAEVSVVAVVLGWTFCTSVALPPGNVASPL